MKMSRRDRLIRQISALGMCLWPLAAMAHDMGNVLIAYVLVLAIPVPALLGLVGWKKAALGLVPIWVVALVLGNAGSYVLMYAVLFSPYAIWIARAALRRTKETQHGV